MKLSISLKYAVRSLSGHVRRTILSIAGIGLGCGLCLFMIGFVRGESKMMLRAAAESGTGHLRVVPAELLFVPAGRLAKLVVFFGQEH